MKIFKLMAIALVALVGLNSCSKDCDHDFIDVDHSADLVGTWTCLEAGYAEALVIKADGSALSTGVEDGEYWENVAGNIVVKNGIATMTFEDGDNFEGHIDVIAGMAFSIYNEDGERMTYNYCANDLADEIVGMWVCTQTTAFDADMSVNIYQADGKALFTGFTPDADGYMANLESTYKVVGDLLIQKMSLVSGGDAPHYITLRLMYSPATTGLGDILTLSSVSENDGKVVESYASLLRVKQSLDLAGKTYDYISSYVTNVKGNDEDFSIMGKTFNIAKIGANDFDMLFRSVLSCLEFPNANSFKHTFSVNGQDAELVVPITVEGNKVTVDMTAVAPVLRKVDMYMYQDADDSQLHMYMPTSSFVNYIANLHFTTLLTEGKIDEADTAAVNKVFTDMAARIQSINVSYVFKKRK